MSTSAGTVYIVDDDISVRESLADLVSTAGWEAQCFAAARDFLACLRSQGPSCLVLDIGLPDLNGLDLQDRVAGESEGMPIIFITGYGDVPMSVRAMKAGAVEFLVKPLNGDALLLAIASAIERSRAFARESHELQALRARYETLSGRERQVMAMVVSGLLNKQVGGKLGISEITVKAHRGRVMGKMMAVSFADLVMMNARLGLTSQPVDR